MLSSPRPVFCPDSKTEHKAFTGTSHRVLMNGSQKCCCFFWQVPDNSQGAEASSYHHLPEPAAERSPVPCTAPSGLSPPFIFHPFHNYFFHGAEKPWHTARLPLWLHWLHPGLQKTWSSSATYWTFMLIKGTCSSSLFSSVDSQCQSEMVKNTESVNVQCKYYEYRKGWGK